MDINDKSAKRNGKGKNTETDFSTLSPIIKCYNCQGYVHVAVNCPTLFKIVIIDRISMKAPKHDSVGPKAHHSSFDDD